MNETKYKRIVAIDTETGEVIGNTFLKNGEEVILSTKKILNENQKEYLRKSKGISEFSKSLGGYVHVFYVKDKLLYNELKLSSANISRFLYLATYISYNFKDKNLLVKKEKGQLIPMNRNDMKNLMKLGKSAFYDFMNEVIDKDLIIEKENKFYINYKYVSKGKIDSEDNYIRLYIDTTRYLYENCTSRQHKQLGYVLKLLPYVDFQTNHITINNKKAEIKDIMSLLGLSIDGVNATSKFKKMLLNFKLKYENKEYYLFGSHTYEYANKQEIYFVINPLVLFGGNDVDSFEDVFMQLRIS